METEQNGYLMEKALNDSFNGLPCIPWEVEYIPGTPAAGYADLNANCESINTLIYPNNPECAILTCKVEGFFILNLLTLVGMGNGVVEEYHVDNGFDHDLNCPTVPGMGGDETRECCGSFPSRRPFHPRNGVNECCENGADFVKIYQPFSHVCCGDKVVENGDPC